MATKAQFLADLATKVKKVLSTTLVETVTATGGITVAKKYDIRILTIDKDGNSQDGKQPMIVYDEGGPNEEAFAHIVARPVGVTKPAFDAALRTYLNNQVSAILLKWRIIEANLDETWAKVEWLKKENSTFSFALYVVNKQGAAAPEMLPLV